MPASLDIAIDPFRPGHEQAFAELNRAWLVAYGLMEEPDERQLADPWEQIIAPGGQIFVALRAGQVVGTCAAVPYQPGVMELAKLVVASSAQGLGLGRRLVEACVGHARGAGIHRLVLLSNSRLTAALRLYEGFGFEHRPMPPDSKYVTADVYMELDLIQAAPSSPSTPPPG